MRTDCKITKCKLIYILRNTRDYHFMHLFTHIRRVCTRIHYPSMFTVRKRVFRKLKTNIIAKLIFSLARTASKMYSAKK